MFFISPVLLVFSLFAHCWKTDGMLITLSLLILGLMLLVYASDRLVYGASVFAQSLKIPPRCYRYLNCWYRDFTT